MPYLSDRFHEQNFNGSAVQEPARPNRTGTFDAAAATASVGRRVLGQAAAMTAIEHALVIAQAGFQDRERPLGSLLLVGPTGVSKTESVRWLAAELRSGPDDLCRLDMASLHRSITRHRCPGLRRATPEAGKALASSTDRRSRARRLPRGSSFSTRSRRLTHGAPCPPRRSGSRPTDARQRRANHLFPERVRVHDVEPRLGRGGRQASSDVAKSNSRSTTSQSTRWSVSGSIRSPAHGAMALR